jgi:hypothetical protein
MLSPIILFIYNRPGYTLKTLQALKNNYLADQSALFIYADGPLAKASDIEKNNILEARKIAISEKWCRTNTIIESETNNGLANSVINGVSKIVSEYGKAIVLEDDIVTSPYFLNYMNDGLDLFQTEKRVISIHGYIYPAKKKLPDYFFIKGADCWGWATWKRGWDIFNPDSEYLLNELKQKKLEKSFNFNNTYNYTGMLQDQIDGKISSWAIRWYASAFLADMYTLYPGKSFIQNIGMDGSGAHSGNTRIYDTELIKNYTGITIHEVTESIRAKKIIMNYFSYNSFISNLKRIKRKIKSRKTYENKINN